MTLYALDGVTRTYRQGDVAIHAVRDISLEVQEGEFLVVVGPSGSGKTTMLQLLGGLDRPTAGTLLFEGRNLATLPDRDLADLRLRAFGFVFQSFNLIPTLSAAENVEAAMAPIGGDRRSRKEKAERLLDEVGLRERADHLPSQLSGGEQQRVAIARAVANDPRVILADEPTGNLDTQTGEEILSLLASLRRAHGATVVVVTHDRSAAKRASRALWVQDGEVSEAEIVRRPVSR